MSSAGRGISILAFPVSAFDTKRRMSFCTLLLHSLCAAFKVDSYSVLALVKTSN